jgi:hypothetical protein
MHTVVGTEVSLAVGYAKSLDIRRSQSGIDVREQMRASGCAICDPEFPTVRTIVRIEDHLICKNTGAYNIRATSAWIDIHENMRSSRRSIAGPPFLAVHTVVSYKYDVTANVEKFAFYGIVCARIDIGDQVGALSRSVRHVGFYPEDWVGLGKDDPFEHWWTSGSISDAIDPGSYLMFSGHSSLAVQKLIFWPQCRAPVASAARIVRIGYGEGK